MLNSLDWNAWPGTNDRWRDTIFSNDEHRDDTCCLQTEPIAVVVVVVVVAVAVVVAVVVVVVVVVVVLVVTAIHVACKKYTRNCVN